MRTRLLMSVMALTIMAAIAVHATPQGAQGAQGAQGERGGGGGGRAGGRGGFNLPPLLMQTDAFPDGGIVPQKFAGRGGVQPGFKFSGAPAATVSYAIIFHDLDVAIGGNTGDVLHWIVWNIPAAAAGLPEGSVPAGSVQGANIAGQNAYFGPGAPAGPRYHHYVFELYALNAMLDLPATAGRDDLLKAMAGKTTAKAAYVGRYRNEAP